MNKLALCFVLVALSGCSDREIYNTVQAGGRYQCSKVPPSQYDECVKRFDKSYDQYNHERKKAPDQ